MLYSADPPLRDQLQNSEIQNIVNILQRNAVYLLKNCVLYPDFLLSISNLDNN